MSVVHGLVWEDGPIKLANVVTLSRGLLIAPILLLLSYGYAGLRRLSST